MLRFGCVLTLILFVAYITAAFRFLPWWGAVLAIAGLILALAYIVPKLVFRGATSFLRRKGLAFIEMKSKVLRDATVEIESVEWVPRPADQMDSSGFDDEGETAQVARRSPWLLRVTAFIRPAGSPQPGEVVRSQDTPFQLYEPSEFTLVSESALPMKEHFNQSIKKAWSSHDDDEDDANPAVVDVNDEEAQAGCHYATITDSTGTEVDADKVNGPHRVTLDFDVPRRLTGRVKPRYYMEDFATFDLPPRPADPPQAIIDAPQLEG